MFFTADDRKRLNRIEEAVGKLYAGLIALSDNDVSLNHKLKRIIMTTDELKVKLEGVETTLDKIGTETSALLVLVEELKNKPLPPDVVELVDRIATKAKSVDDLVEG